MILVRSCCLAIALYPFCDMLFGLLEKLPPVRGREKKPWKKGAVFGITLGAVFLLWIPVWMAYYPIVMSYDFHRQVNEAYNGWAWFNSYQPLMADLAFSKNRRGARLQRNGNGAAYFIPNAGGIGVHGLRLHSHIQNNREKVGGSVDGAVLRTVPLLLRIRDDRYKGCHFQRVISHFYNFADGAQFFLRRPEMDYGDPFGHHGGGDDAVPL